MRRIGNVVLAIVLAFALVIPVSLNWSDAAFAKTKNLIERKKDKEFDNNHTSKEWKSRGGKIKIEAWYDIDNANDKGTIKVKLQKKKGDEWKTVQKDKITAKGTDNRQNVTFDKKISDGTYRIFFDGPNQNFINVNNRLSYSIYQEGPKQESQFDGKKLASGKNKEFDNNTTSEEWKSNGSKVHVELWYDIDDDFDDEKMTLEFQKWKKGKFKTVQKKKVKSEGFHNRIDIDFDKEIEKDGIYRIFFNGPNPVIGGDNRITYNVYQLKIKEKTTKGKAEFIKFDRVNKDGKLLIKARADFGKINLKKLKGKWQFKVVKKSKKKKTLYKSKWYKAKGNSHKTFEISPKKFKDEKKAQIIATFKAEKKDLLHGKITKYKAEVSKDSKKPKKEQPKNDDSSDNDSGGSNDDKEKDNPKDDNKDKPKDDNKKKDDDKDKSKDDDKKKDDDKDKSKDESAGNDKGNDQDPPADEQKQPEVVTIQAENNMTAEGNLTLKAWLQEQINVNGNWTFAYADQEPVTQSGSGEVVYTIPKDKLQDGKYDLQINFESEDKKVTGELSLVVEVEGMKEQQQPSTDTPEADTENETITQEPSLQEVHSNPEPEAVTPPQTTDNNKQQLGGPLPKTATSQPVGLLVGAGLLLVGLGYFTVRYFRRKSA